MSGIITIADLAGHGSEAVAWKLLKEVSEQVIAQKNLIINPFIIEINENGYFALTPSSTQQPGFDAPEVTDNERTEASASWSLGATVFFAVTGRQVMNGKGGQGQSETSRLPFLRSEWPQLSELVMQCLHFSPQKRPSIKEINIKANNIFERCKNDIKRGPKFKQSETPQSSDGVGHDTDFWPETMQPNNN